MYPVGCQVITAYSWGGCMYPSSGLGPLLWHCLCSLPLYTASQLQNTVSFPPFPTWHNNCTWINNSLPAPVYMFIAPVKPTLVSTNISLGTRPSSKLHCRLSSNNEATSYKTVLSWNDNVFFNQLHKLLLSLTSTLAPLFSVFKFYYWSNFQLEKENKVRLLSHLTMYS